MMLLDNIHYLDSIHHYFHKYSYLYNCIFYCDHIRYNVRHVLQHVQRTYKNTSHHKNMTYTKIVSIDMVHDNISDDE